jgi:hypothetical protein
MTDQWVDTGLFPCRSKHRHRCHSAVRNGTKISKGGFASLRGKPLQHRRIPLVLAVHDRTQGDGGFASTPTGREITAGSGICRIFPAVGIFTTCKPANLSEALYLSAQVDGFHWFTPRTNCGLGADQNVKTLVGSIRSARFTPANLCKPLETVSPACGAWLAKVGAR